MTAAIAAFRARKHPHFVQVFEVGTATMMAGKGRRISGGNAQTLRLGGIREAARGKGMPLAFSVAQLHLFDSESGQRLN